MSCCGLFIPQAEEVALCHQCSNRAKLLAEHSVACAQDHIKLLERERSKMEERWKDGVKLFRQWKGHLLAETEHSKTIPAFLDQCVLPRCTMTPEDAMYCAAFVRRMALEDTPFFSFMRFSQMVSIVSFPLAH